MREQRYIGIDLHRRRFTCCVRLGSGRNSLSEWSLEQLPQFVKKLRSLATRGLFYEAVAPQVARVVVVDPNQFRVISHSVKKTDPNDARNLALYLAKGLLPEVRMKEKAQAEVAPLPGSVLRADSRSTRHRQGDHCPSPEVSEHHLPYPEKRLDFRRLPNFELAEDTA